MPKMISTHEMVQFLYDQVLSKDDELFIATLHHIDSIGQITKLPNSDIDRLDNLYTMCRISLGLDNA